MAESINILRDIEKVYMTTGKRCMTNFESAEEYEKLLNGVAALESIATADACTLSVKEDRKVSLSEITNA